MSSGQQSAGSSLSSPAPESCPSQMWRQSLALPPQTDKHWGCPTGPPPLPTVLLLPGRPREGGRNEWRRNEKVCEEKGNRAGHEAPGPAPRATESSLPPPPPPAAARVPAAAHSGDRNAILGALWALLSPGLVPRLAEPKRLWFGGAETGRRAADSIPFRAVIFPSSPPRSPRPVSADASCPVRARAPASPCRQGQLPGTARGPAAGQSGRLDVQKLPETERAHSFPHVPRDYSPAVPAAAAFTPR